MISSRIFTSCTLPSVMRINVGILPRRSNKVCILTAALYLRKFAHGNKARHKSMVVESNALEFDPDRRRSDRADRATERWLEKSAESGHSIPSRERWSHSL